MADNEDDPPTPLRRRWATTALAVVNVSVFFAMVMAGLSPFMLTPADLSAAGGVDPARVWQGEIWRLFTACFVHVAFWHVGMNVFVLWIVGTPLERLIGGARLLLIYITSGAFGFACSVAFNGAHTAGASGAVFGVVGALLAVALLTRHAELGRTLFQALMPFVVATFVLGFLVPIMDNAAHLGGLLFGFALGYGLSRNASEEKSSSIWDLTVLMGSAVVFAAMLLYAGRPVLSPRFHVVDGVQAILDKNLPEAKEHARRAARLAPEDGATFLLIARVMHETASTEAMRAEARRVTRAGIEKLDRDDTQDAFDEATRLLGLAGGDADVGYRDTRTVSLLCDAALEIVGETPSLMAPILKNQCAWVRLKSRDPAVHDPAGALILARQAVEESGGTDATIVHTLAEALAQNGDPKEGLRHLEKLVATGRTGSLGGFLDDERARLKRLVSEQDAAGGNRVGSP